MAESSRAPLELSPATRAAPLRGLRAAFTSFSRLPIGGFPYSAREWRWAAAHLPCVGVATGAFSACFWLGGGAAGLGSQLCALLALGSSVLFTGGIHEDGLADAADGLGGAHGGQRALEIMKDSRIGSFGALALAFSLLFRLAALAELPRGGWFWLIEIHCLARVGPVWLMHSEAYVSDSERSKSAQLFPIARGQLAVALGWALACSSMGVAAGWVRAGVVALIGLVLAGLGWGAARFFRVRVGGVTGDLLGALEQVGEIAAWLTVLSCHAA